MFAASPGKQCLAVALAALAAASMWVYVQTILIPSQIRDAVRFERPRGNLSDLYPRWLGARELLLHGRDPYSAEMTRDIQKGVFGRQLDTSRANDPKDQFAFAYPVYVSFLLAPTLTMDFDVLRPLVSFVLAILVLLSVPIWNRVLGTNLNVVELLLAGLLTFGSFPVVQGIRLQQLTFVVATLLALSFLARQAGWLRLSGFLMALATIKPHLALLPIFALILWSAAEVRRRQNWLWGFFGTMAILFAASERILPGWILKFLSAVHDYQRYTGGLSLLQIYLPHGVGTVLGCMVLAYVVWLCWKRRGFSADASESRELVWLLLIATVCALPGFPTYNQIFLLPALLAFSQQDLFQDASILVRGFAGLTGFLLLWAWVASLSLLVANPFLQPETHARLWQIPLYGTLQLPLAVLALAIAQMWASKAVGKIPVSSPKL
jgi:hypothetical protein